METEAHTHAETPDMENSAEAQALGLDYQPQLLTQSMAMKNLDEGAQDLAKDDQAEAEAMEDPTDGGALHH